MFHDIRLSRRAVLQLLGLGAAALSFPSCSGVRKKFSTSAGDAKSRSEAFGKISPIDRSLGDRVPAAFCGETPDRAHPVLWDKQGYIASLGGKVPEPTENASVVVVGGGISGLMAAYLLRDHRPILLEQAPRFGGNSKGESWKGIEYSTGAAYFLEQDPGSGIQKLFSELNIDEMIRIKKTEDPVILNQKRYDRFWHGETDPKHRQQFAKLDRHFRDIWNGENGQLYPEIPTNESSMREHVNALDRKSFRAYLESRVQGKLHPHIETALEHYCWSTFASPLEEVSAAAGVNAYAAEFGDIYVTPGGNAAVAERVLERLAEKCPPDHFRAGSLVFDVQVVSDGAIVAYRDSEGNARSIHAKAVVMACPKFIAARLVRDLEENRVTAIRKLKYRAYLVANVLLKGGIKDDFYDLFLLQDGKTNPRDIMSTALAHKATDVVLGTYAKPDANHSVLTFYRGMPYDGGRAQVFSGDSYSRYKSEFEEQTLQMLALLGRKQDDIVDLRITRWGHPMPVPGVGLIASGVTDAVRRPFRERVYFVQQDNWALAAIETGTEEALHFAPKIRTLLA